MQKEITVSIDTDLIEEATELFASLGLTLEDAIRIFLEQSVQVQGFPFPMQKMSHGDSLSNECPPWSEVPETKAAIAEIEAGGGKTFGSVDELMKDLYAAD